MINKGNENRISVKLKQLGLQMDYKIFVYMRLVSTALLFVGLLFLSPYGYFVAPITSLVYYFFLEFVILDLGIRKRAELFESQADLFFSTFLLLLRDDRNIKNALTMTTKVITNELSDVFKKVLRNVQVGKTLDEALQDLKDCMPSMVITNILVSIMEANRFGNPLNESISVQLQYIRDMRQKKIVRQYKVIPYKAALLSLVFGFLMIGVLLLFVICV